MYPERRNFHRLAGVGFWLWLMLMFLASAWPGLSTPETRGHPLFRPDYLFHFGVNFVLTGMFIAWKASPGRFRPAGRYLLPLALLMVTGSLLEVIQLAIPGRTFNPVDLIYNLTGIVTGSLVLLLFPGSYRKSAAGHHQ